MGWGFYLYYVPGVLSAIGMCVLLVVLARRARVRALWWLLAALGAWPLCTHGFYAVMQTLMQSWVRSAGIGVYYIQLVYLCSSLLFTLITTTLQIIAVVAIYRAVNVVRTTSSPLCPLCGYNLTGLRDTRCPECGTGFVCETRYVTRPATAVEGLPETAGGATSGAPLSSAVGEQP